MSRPGTRRDFLKLTTLGMAATLAGGALLRPRFAYGAASVSSDPGLAGWITSGQERLEPLAGLAWKASSAAAGGTLVSIDEDRKFQPILGFGAALTDASCFVIDGMPAKARSALMHELFHPSALGLTVCRSCIGSSDYSTSVYSYDEGAEDPDLKHFSIEHDRKYILPVIREAQALNPDFYLFASPWSPPGWMKPNGSMLGGSMRKKWLDAYAKYFVKFLQGYRDEKVRVRAVTVQNEVDTDQDGKMPACFWPQELEAEFIQKHLGPALQGAGLETEIWFLDHNYDLWGRAYDELEKEGFQRYAKGLAWHGYVGDAQMMSRVHDAFPSIPMYWTEGGPNLKRGYFGDWASWGKTISDVLGNWCRSITSWNVALDEKGHPNIGPFFCGGLVSVDSQTHEIARSGQYWAIGHFSRHIRPGAIRIGSESKTDGLSHLAVRNPDGGKVLVLTSTATDPKKIVVQAGERALELELPANSIVTLAWS